MVVQPGQSLIISCQVSGYSLTDNSYATGWIRQSEGKPMDWICHRWGGGNFYQNNDLKNKFLYHTHTSTSSVTLTDRIYSLRTQLCITVCVCTVMQTTKRPAQIPSNQQDSN
ncbi:hypothetical protein FQN60_002523, partial [Etheostoma spectabile]